MKVLTLNHFESDFGADSILIGLHQLAAWRGWTVAELPIIRHIHGEVDSQYRLADGGKGFTGPTEDTIRNHPPYPNMSEEEALDRCTEFDLIILTSTRAYARDALSRVVKRSGKQPKDLPLVVCDFDDHDFIDFRYLEELKPKLFLKRELLRQDKPFSPFAWGGDIPVWPLQFAAHYANLEPGVLEQKKSLDIFCSLGKTHPTRDQLISALLEAVHTIGCSHYLAYSPPDGISDPHGLLKGRETWDGYMRLLASARLSACTRGWGRDTLHYWEGFMAGTTMMVDDPGLIIPHPFIPHDHYIPIEPPYADIAGKIKLYLSKPQYLEEKRLAAHQHCLKFHTTERRAEYLTKIAEAYIYGSKPIDPEEFGL